MRNLTISPSITREGRSLERYLSELNKIPLIDAEEELQLARRIRAGDRKALEQLVRANLRFVVSVAKQYQNPYLSLMDLISEGNIGLLMAAERFDETKGFKFISYAVWWIRKLIMEAIREKSRLVRLPGAKWRELKRLRAVTDALEQEIERKATVEEVAEVTGLSTDVVEELMRIGARRLSVHAPFEGDHDRALLDVLVDGEIPSPDAALMERESMRKEVNDLLAGLPEREARILRLYFGLDEGPKLQTSASKLQASVSGLDDIGKEVGLCGERVRLLKNRALLRLRMKERSSETQRG